MKARVGMALPADNGTYKMPISAGVTVERKLNDFLGIETGLLYSNLRSAGQHLHYLGIPVRVNVTLMDTKKVDLYATVGGIADKCVAGAPDNSFKEEPVQLAVTAGIGINYKINDRLALLPNQVFRIISARIRSWLRCARNGRLILIYFADFA